MSCDLAETCVFDKQSLGPILCDPSRSKRLIKPRGRLSLSRSYRHILPSSLTRVISSALEYSSHLPVSVCGTVTIMTRLEGFLGSSFPRNSAVRRQHLHHAQLKSRICLGPSTPTRLNGNRHSAPIPTLRHSITQTPLRQYRNINLFPIDYAFRPRLRGRLTLR